MRSAGTDELVVYAGQPRAGLRVQVADLEGQQDLINAALTNPDGTLSQDILPDLPHLSGKGYALWTHAMEPTIQKLLSQPKSHSSPP